VDSADASSTSGRNAAAGLLRRNREVALLMTDVMPVMNGRELADEALRLKPDLRVLFATGYTRSAMVRSGTLDDGVELIMKSYSFEALAQKVAKVLDVGPADHGPHTLEDAGHG
jgi:DNA-binding NarL/FixJ family response regulator